MDEFGHLEWGRVDAAERGVFALECGGLRLDICADVAGFGTEEDVKEELNSIGLVYVSIWYNGK